MIWAVPQMEPVDDERTASLRTPQPTPNDRERSLQDTSVLKITEMRICNQFKYHIILYTFTKMNQSSDAQCAQKLHVYCTETYVFNYLFD